MYRSWSDKRADACLRRAKALRGTGGPSQRRAVPMIKATRAARLFRQNFPRLLELLRRVDAERDTRDNRDVDAHTGIHRAELLELLASFIGGGRQADEFLERRAAIGVEPDVV